MKIPLCLTSERLVGEPLSQQYVAFIRKLLNTDGWITYIGNKNIHSDEDALNYINRIVENPAIYYWVIKLKEDGTPIGIITFIQRTYLEYPDIGFAFLPAFQKNRFAYEAATALLSELKKEKTLKIILASTQPSNVNSIRLLSKLGFAFDKTIQEGADVFKIYAITNG